MALRLNLPFWFCSRIKTVVIRLINHYGKSLSGFCLTMCSKMVCLKSLLGEIRIWYWLNKNLVLVVLYLSWSVCECLYNRIYRKGCNVYGDCIHHWCCRQWYNHQTNFFLVSIGDHVERKNLWWIFCSTKFIPVEIFIKLLIGKSHTFFSKFFKDEWIL